MFKVGDFVKGNDNHCNLKRREDLGVVVTYPVWGFGGQEGVGGVWVCWTSDLSKHYAHFHELTLVKAPF